MQVSLLIQNAKRYLSGMEWEDRFAPPEGKFGQGGADPHTELLGFKRDGHAQVISRLENAFGSKMDVPEQDVGDLLTTIAYEQRPNSAGPFVRYFALELRDNQCPDYIKGKIRQTFAAAAEKPDAEAFFTKIGQNLPVLNEDHLAIVDQVRTQLAGHAVTPARLADAFDSMGDDYYRSGQDYMAEIADELKNQARQLATEQDRGLEAEVSRVRQLEAGWGRPLAGPGN